MHKGAVSTPLIYSSFVSSPSIYSNFYYNTNLTLYISPFAKIRYNANRNFLPTKPLIFDKPTSQDIGSSMWLQTIASTATPLYHGFKNRTVDSDSVPFESIPLKHTHRHQPKGEMLKQFFFNFFLF